MSASLSELAGRPVIVGAGAAGLMTALQLAPMPCVLVSAGPIGATSSSILAQGGLAAAVGPDDDVALHLDDTLAAGDGHCDPAAAAHIIAAAPRAVAELLRIGACFDRRGADDVPAPFAAMARSFGRSGVPEAIVAPIFSGMSLGLEAAHSRRRILHARGDSSGAEVVRALVDAVRCAAHVTVLEGLTAGQILTEDGMVTGLTLHSPDGAGVLATRQIVLATGGIGGLYLSTTNPLSSTGSGIALAARAGAAVSDMEFVQFHPTALDLGHGLHARNAPASLISEAVRGEGALLVNDRGERFMAGTPGAELAPRDVAARAIWREQQAGRRTFLDARARPGPDFARRFPAITGLCANAGLDPGRDLLPVTTAAHYHMGGVAVDLHGRSSLTGLWACGEVACTGLHGANRLASNSLIEAVVCGGLVANDIRGQPASRAPQPFRAAPRHRVIAFGPTPDMAAVRSVMSVHVGLERNADGLRQAITQLAPLANNTASPAADAALVGLLVAFAALRREESRGGQFRTDFPAKAADSRRGSLHLPLMLAEIADLTGDAGNGAPQPHAGASKPDFKRRSSVRPAPQHSATPCLRDTA